MSAPLQISQRSSAGVVVLELSGMVVGDEEDRRVFRQQVEAIVSAGSRSVLLDLRNVTYMDSAGAGTLIAGYLHVVRRGGVLKLLCPSERVYRTLQITHLLSIFEVFDDEERALGSFAASAHSTPPVIPPQSQPY